MCEGDKKMADFVDLLIVIKDINSKKIYYAPFASGIIAGDCVIVDEPENQTHAAVEYVVGDVFSVMKDSDIYRLAEAVTGDIKRIKGKVEPIDYTGEDSIKENDNV